MLTFSLVDIDRDESGEPKAHFLIKRAVGAPGDWFKMKNGDFFIRFAGMGEWIAEQDHNKAFGYTHHLTRLVEEKSYPALEAAGKASAYTELNITPPSSLIHKADAVSSLRNHDYLAYDKARLTLLRAARPDDERYRTLLARYRLGWYVPEGRMLPLGDNRDNSRDGRYFGPVSRDKILGQGAFIYWPIGRFGAIR
jgi:signal peptidase I